MKLPLRSAGLLAVAVGVAFTVGCSGCGTADPNKTTGTSGKAVAADPWPRFVAAVRKNPDPKAARAAVAELTGGLTNAPPSDKPKTDPAAVDAAAAALKLTDAEKRYIAGGEYTPLDANHLSECLYLADIVAGLGVTPADPPPVRADAAFRFVCREVVLAPSLFGQTLLPPVPPTFVLSRGSGSGLERAFTFVALCRQLDLDAYLIGPPSAADQSWTHRGTAADNQPPKGPFWAVGVRTPGGVLLFDPWRGEPVPGKAADRPITLAELKADPSACPWTADKAKPWDVTADQIKEGGLFLSPPLPSLAPRMATMQEKLRDGVGVQLATDWAAAVRAADGAPVAGWNPKGDRFTPVRVLGSFLPLDQGGLDATPEKDSLFSQYDIARVPVDRLQLVPVGVNDSAKGALAAVAAGVYREAFLTTPTPRERIQRGQYNVAVEQMVKRRDEFEKQLRSAPAGGEPEELKEWYKALNAVFNRLNQAQGGVNEQAAREEVDRFLRSSDRFLRQAVGGMMAEVGVGEARYLLALAIHEQAEALEAAAVRAERERNGTAEARAAAREQWAKAENGWKRYAEYAAAQAASFPGRKQNADALAARAAKLAK